MIFTSELIEIQDYIIDRINCGIFVVDRSYSIILWNKYLETHSELLFKDIRNKNLFDCIPELNQKWLSRKIDSVFAFKNFSFTSWKERPYLLRLPHHQPQSNEIDCMRQDCTFFPIMHEQEVKYVCIMMIDVTESCMYESALKKTVHQLEIFSQIDGLTGLYNRRMIDQKLNDEFMRAKRYGSTFSFALMDLDHFKHVNDTYGHAGGDEVLKAVSKVLKRSFRETDIVGRFGGEEFAILLTNTDPENTLLALDRFRQEIESLCIPHEDQIIGVTASIGFSSFNSNVVKFETIVKEADDALYQSKENGRNQTTRFTQ